MVAVKKKFPQLTNGNIDIDTWLTEIKKSYPEKDISLIEKAAHLAATTTKGLTTFYGQPCIEQSLEMTEIILSLKLDQEAIAASLLNTASQHTKLTHEMIKNELNENIAKLVSGVAQMSVINLLRVNLDKNRNQTQIDRLRKTFLAMASDIRVVLIKLAEQMSIMRGIKKINTAERTRIAQETLDIYAPLANRLGIGQLKWELEDLAFHYINPDTYKLIAKFIAERRVDREKRIQEMTARLTENFNKTHIKASLSGRAKHIYSIYLKAQKKQLDYKDIYDYSAVRILVQTLDDCYTALSIVHNLWEHIPEEFDDYISNPKPNGYRSIHTAVIGPDGKHLEVQIRTNDMHQEAEHGLAAHWLYKENKIQQSGYETKITFLRQLLSWHKEVAQQETKPDQPMNEIFEDRVYTFTPAGEIIDLPQGATPLDFAYHIHSGLGARCRGAKINGHIVPLTHTLHTGDRVDIIATPNGTPSRDWLNKESGYLKTARARAKVAQWFKQQDVTQYVEIGKQMLERELARVGIQHIDLQKVATHFNFKNAESLLTTLGHGSIRAAQIVNAAQIEQNAASNKPIQPTLIKKQLSHTTPLQISGAEDLLTRIAKCCKPIPGDTIIGYITQGRGVSIHKLSCSNVSNLLSDHGNRLLQVNWDSKHIGTYYADLQIHAQGHEPVLKEITSVLANIKIDLISLNSSINKKTQILFITMTVQLQNLAQLDHLMTVLRQLPYVQDVKRLSEKP